MPSQISSKLENNCTYPLDVLLVWWNFIQVIG